MSRAFNSEARRQFLEAAPLIAAEFRPQPGPKPWATPGETALARTASSRLITWICLVPSPKGYNQFTIELGWSRLGRYPELTLRPSLPAPGVDGRELSTTEYLCRLGALAPSVPDWWSHCPTEDPADLLANAAALTTPLTVSAARPIVAALMAQALQALHDHGLPYLARLEVSAA